MILNPGDGIRVSIPISDAEAKRYEDEYLERRRKALESGVESVYRGICTSRRCGLPLTTEYYFAGQPYCSLECADEAFQRLREGKLRPEDRGLGAPIGMFWSVCLLGLLIVCGLFIYSEGWPIFLGLLTASIGITWFTRRSCKEKKW